jgi:hypothetical protein
LLSLLPDDRSNDSDVIDDEDSDEDIDDDGYDSDEDSDDDSDDDDAIAVTSSKDFSMASLSSSIFLKYSSHKSYKIVNIIYIQTCVSAVFDQSCMKIAFYLHLLCFKQSMI